MPTARVVVVAGADDREDRRRAIKAGAVGVVDREQTAARAAEVTRRVAWGRCELGPADVDGLLATYAAFARQAGSVQQQVAPPTLDARQQQVLELLAADRPPAEVAAELGLAPATVENLVGDAVAALHRHTRAEAITFAVGRPGCFGDGRRAEPAAFAPVDSSPSWVFSTSSSAPVKASKVRALQALVPDINALEPEMQKPCPTTRCRPRPASSASASTTARTSTTC